MVITFFLVMLQTTAWATWVEPPYSDLPDPLIMEDGKPVQSIDQWENTRRAELLELFSTQVYGVTPDPETYTATFEVTNTIEDAAGGTATRKTVQITIAAPLGEHVFNTYVFIPNNATGPVPFILCMDTAFTDFSGTDSTSDSFPLNNLIIPRGYGCAYLYRGALAPDNPGTWQTGLIEKFGLTGPDAWKAIGAWAFGASRVMDYLQTDPDVDPNRIAMIGWSRNGKATLWCCAQDQRFAMAIDNKSGCTGSTLSRREYGETLAMINTNFPYWFCDNYDQYNGLENTLPVDQHELLALIAPRGLYVGAGSCDAWQDPRGAFYSCVYAQPVFSLYDVLDTKNGIGCAPPTSVTWALSDYPKKATAMKNGVLAYHLYDGGHDLSLWDWENYLDHADAVMTGDSRTAHVAMRAVSPLLPVGLVAVFGIVLKRYKRKKQSAGKQSLKKAVSGIWLASVLVSGLLLALTSSCEMPAVNATSTTYPPIEAAGIATFETDSIDSDLGGVGTWSTYPSNAGNVLFDIHQTGSVSRTGAGALQIAFKAWNSGVMIFHQMLAPTTRDCSAFTNWSAWVRGPAGTSVRMAVTGINCTVSDDSYSDTAITTFSGGWDSTTIFLNDFTLDPKAVNGWKLWYEAGAISEGAAEWITIYMDDIQLIN